MPRPILHLLGAAALASSLPIATHAGAPSDPVRVATFNAYLNRFAEGDLLSDLSTPDDAQARAVAEIIQRTAPDIILLNEFDFDPNGDAIDAFRTNYLEVSQNGAPIATYPYVYLAPSNTGLPSGFDLDNNGEVVDTPGSNEYGNDCFGFGTYPGQYGMVLLSRYPIVEADVRTFQTFRWMDMPGALLPVDPDSNEPFYSAEELEVFRLSSKSHWDVPIDVNGAIVHILCAHPTPPVFDGPEDRNGTRNHDEIRFWADYTTPGAGSYIYDDAGVPGGLSPDAAFVILGDYNADPIDGDGIDGGIEQLLDAPHITDPHAASLGGVDAALRQADLNLAHLGPASRDTGDFFDVSPGNLRADYVLPAATLGVIDTGVFWPCEGDDHFALIGAGFPVVSSDHRLVWADLDLTGPAAPLDAFPASYRLDYIGEATFATGTMFADTEIGGLSGFAYDPAIDAFYALSDDRSQINDARFYALTIDLSDGMLSDGDVAFKSLLPLQRNDGTPFPELSLDPEGLALSSFGELFVASEGDADNGIDPFVDLFSPIGRQLAALPIPAKYRTGTPGLGIRNNLAFESLTLTPDENRLFTATENALVQDGPPATLVDQSPSRIMAFDLSGAGATAEYVYMTDEILDAPVPPEAFATNGLVELLALTDDRLLAMERSFAVGVGNGIRLYEVTLDGADDVAALESIGSLGITPVTKSLVLDLADLGITLDNVEGMAFGAPLPDGRRTLILVSDNNFGATQFTQFLAFAIDACPADLDGSGAVDFADLLDVLVAFGRDDSAADINADGIVDVDDIVALLAAWGACG